MIMQPSVPAAPAAPGLSAQERAEVVQSLRQAHQASREVQQIVEQTDHEFAGKVGAAASAQTGVIKDNVGRIVVNGPDGKTVVIDPRIGLDGDQIQEMVRTALQPTVHDTGPKVPDAVLAIVAMAFTFLLLVVWMISRGISGRRAASGTTTAVLPAEATARLARIEQAVEAVAIEVERISEAQRYSAQLLTDRLATPAPTLPAVATAPASTRG